jgi:Mg/Co/Ni transporter MgtE
VAEGEEFVGGESLWCDDDDGDEVCVIDNTSFDDNIRERGRWLVGLLVLQSCSSFILSANEALLQKHPSIIYFLTMLVGAGGNAGNQASVRVIRGLALGTLTSKNQGDFLRKELTTAFYLSLLLSVAGFARAVLFKVPGALEGGVESEGKRSSEMSVAYILLCLTLTNLLAPNPLASKALKPWL